VRFCRESYPSKLLTISKGIFRATPDLKKQEGTFEGSRVSLGGGGKAVPATSNSLSA
jgi:hypothetical protein